jgi:hypothetical protein
MNNNAKPKSQDAEGVGFSELLATEDNTMVKAFEKWWLTRRPNFANDKNWWLKVDVRNAFSAFKNGYKAAQGG